MNSKVIINLDNLDRKLIKRLERYEESSVIVGYTAAYALYVHENLEMKLKGEPRKHKRSNYWDPAGIAQPKFLEQPAREEAKRIGAIIREALEKGANFTHALYLGGLYLQRVSMALVPIDTGNLRLSAFTRKEV